MREIICTNPFRFCDRQPLPLYRPTKGKSLQQKHTLRIPPKYPNKLYNLPCRYQLLQTFSVLHQPVLQGFLVLRLIIHRKGLIDVSLQSCDCSTIEETLWPKSLSVTNLPSPTSVLRSLGFSSCTTVTKVKSNKKSTAPTCRRCSSNNLKKRRLQKCISKLKKKYAKLRLEIKEMKNVSLVAHNVRVLFLM